MLNQFQNCAEKVHSSVSDGQQFVEGIGTFTKPKIAFKPTFAAPGSRVGSEECLTLVRTKVLSKNIRIVSSQTIIDRNFG